MMRRRAIHKRNSARGVLGPRLAKRPASLGASLGLPALETDALIQKLQTGLSFRALESFSSESSIPISEIGDTMQVPERTLARRRVAGRLSSEESEKLLRLSNIFEQAVDLFEGDVKAAVAWLRSPKRALAYKAPLTYARTEIGARQVEDLIGKLEQGVFT
jgi:putative toxin-antitoxin system antitoxin component (TIGR02293 family)